jgi:hypothetical protein
MDQDQHGPPAQHVDRPRTRPKVAQIRADQQDSLDALARELHDARTVRGERITANTLIRIAIDGLVEHSGRLQGDNETQLRTAWLDFLANRSSETTSGSGSGR